jgi:hypothetical protein
MKFTPGGQGFPRVKKCFTFDEVQNDGLDFAEHFAAFAARVADQPRSGANFMKQCRPKFTG